MISVSSQHPGYFIENQISQANPHNALSPNTVSQNYQGVTLGTG